MSRATRCKSSGVTRSTSAMTSSTVRTSPNRISCIPIQPETFNVSGWIGMQEILFGEVRTVDDVIADVERVTPDDLQRVARDILRQDQLSAAVVGPYRGRRRFLPLLT